MVNTRDFFIRQGLKEAQIEDFIRQKFPSGDYSHMQIQRTPLGIKIVIYTNKPGRVIGKGGRIINEMTSTIREKFSMENPELEVRGIENPDLDSHIVAKQIATALLKGFNYKKIGNMVLKRVMDAGAVGAQIKIAGKVSGSKAMTVKFMAGYLKLAGYPATELVDTAYEAVLTRPGIIGVTVKIMKKDMESESRWHVAEPAAVKPEEKVAAPAKAEPAAAEEKPAIVEELAKEATQKEKEAKPKKAPAKNKNSPEKKVAKEKKKK